MTQNNIFSYFLTQKKRKIFIHKWKSPASMALRLICDEIWWIDCGKA